MRTMLAEAAHPILYPGGGVISSGAAAAFTELATHLEIPVLYTLMGKGSIPDDHPLAVGMTGFWGTAFNNSTAMKADVMMAIAKVNGFRVEPTGLQHGTVSFVFEDNGVEVFEVTTLREDQNCDGRHADVVFTTSANSGAA